MKKILFVSLLCLIYSLVNAQNQPFEVKGINYEGIVFPKEFDLDEPDSIRRWTPSQEDIELAEQILYRFLKEVKGKKSLIIKAFQIAQLFVRI